MTYDIDNGSRGGRRDPACARSRRTSRVHEGTAFTIDVRDAGVRRDAIARVIAWLHRIDAVFSTYRADSDISRMQRRELRLADAAPRNAAGP